MKLGLGILAGLAAAIALIYAYMYIEVYLTYSGSKYAVIENAAGDCDAVVMQGYYFDEERLIARYGENYGEMAQPEDMMRDFHAYRMVGDFFMDTKAGSDAVDHIYIGEDSEATLMYEWLDEKTLRFYIENPEEDDRGEIVVTFE